MRVEVDPTRCDGVGMCAYLAPDAIALDRWGFPLLPRAPRSGAGGAALERAIAGCPRSALRRVD